MKAFSGLFLVAVLAAPLLHGQSAAISIDRTQYFSQKGDLAGNPVVAAENLPVALNIHVRKGINNISAWAPAFYKPGSGGTPGSGASSATNTGTLNFSATPNNGTDFMFVHDFSSTAALEAFYPNGDYGIVFQGSGAPATFTAGLQFTNSTYPSVTPQITATTNGAAWTPNGLRLASNGVTTLTLNTFSQYDTATFGAVIGVGIYKTATGEVVNPSVEYYNLPMGDSTATPAPHYDTPNYQVSIDSDWLIPGVSYTIEIHYTLFSGRPEEANLTPTGGTTEEFQGVASSRKITTIQVRVPGSIPADFNGDGQSDLIWRNPTTGEVIIAMMNGTSEISRTTIGNDPDWDVRGTGDFNGDGQSDILWRQISTGRVIVWLMNGTTRASWVDISTSLEWQVCGTGDFNSDGQSDLLWREASTGRVIAWLMNGTTRASWVDISTSLEWQVCGTGDFNNDGQSDILWRETSTGRVIAWLMNGTTRASWVDISTSLEWQICGGGDFNNDGQSDILWRESSTGRVIVWLMNGTTRASWADVATLPGWQVRNN